MSKEVRELMKRHLEKRGKNQGIADLMAATGKGQRTIERWIEGANNPDIANTRAIALACDCSKEEADALAGFAPQKAKRAG